MKRVFTLLGSTYPPLPLPLWEVLAAVALVLCWIAGWQLVSFAIFVGIIAWRT